MAFSKITGSGLGSQVVDTAQLKDDAVTSAKVDTNIAVAGTLGVTGAVTNSSTLQQTGQVTMGSGGTNWTLPTARGADNYVLTTTSGTGSWIEIALAPDITGITWYSDSSYSDVLTAADDDVFKAVPDFGVAVRMDHCGVTGMEPAPS